MAFVRSVAFVRSIGQRAPDMIFGKRQAAGTINHQSSELADNDLDQDIITFDTTESPIFKHQEHEEVPVDTQVDTKGHRRAAGADDDLEKNLLALAAFAHDQSFVNELSEFESNLMAMQVAKDTFEEDFERDDDGISNVKSEIEDEIRDLTELGLCSCRVEDTMLPEEVRSSFASAIKADDVDERIVSADDEIAAFEATLLSKDVPNDDFEGEFDNDIINLRSEIEDDIRFVTMVEDELRNDIMMAMEEISAMCRRAKF